MILDILDQSMLDENNLENVSSVFYITDEWNFQMQVFFIKVLKT